MAVAVVVGGCSSNKGDSTGDPSVTSRASSIDLSAAGGELGTPILDGNDTGYFVPLRSSQSFETLKAGTTETNQSGSLLKVTSGDNGPFIVTMEDDAVDFLRINKGWKVDKIAHDPVWRPSTLSAAPHLAVGHAGLSRCIHPPLPMRLRRMKRVAH